MTIAPYTSALSILRIAPARSVTCRSKLVPVGALQQAGHDLITERPVLGRLAAGHLTTAILINDRNREVLQVLGRVEEGTRIARRK